MEPRLLLTHFRYGQLAWEPVGAPADNTIEFHYQQAWRRTYYAGPPNVGDTIDTFTVLDFGDGSSVPINLKVLSTNTTEDWLYGEMVAADGSEGIVHTYSAGGDFTAFMESGDRISTLQNNHDGPFRNETIVNVGTGNASPITSLSPIVQVADNTVVHFQVPAIDPNSDTLTYRLATSAEAGGSGGFVQPTGFSVDANSGMVTWDITDATLPSVDIDQLWTAQVIVEDHDAQGAIKSKVPVDFLMKVVSTVSAAPVFDSVPTSPVSITINQLFTFTVQASDPDAGDTVGVQALNPPQGMTFLPGTVAPGSAANATALQGSWTPTAVGSFVITFQATDNTGLTTPATIIVNVVNQPVEVAAAIDILPGCSVNKVNLCSKGTLPVAVLGTASFDATLINTTDLSQIHFGDPSVTARVSPTSAKLKDVNCDGKMDLLLCFSIPAIASSGALVAGSTQGECTGVMQGNTPFRGMDSVVIQSKCTSVVCRVPVKNDSNNCDNNNHNTNRMSTSRSGNKPNVQGACTTSSATAKPWTFYKQPVVTACKPLVVKSGGLTTKSIASHAARDRVFQQLGSQSSSACSTSSPKVAKVTSAYRTRRR